MKTKHVAFVLTALVGLNVSACASIVKGSTASVAITTPPTEGATCTLTSPEGSWQVTSPGAVKVSRSKHDINVKCTKDGFREASAVIPSSFEGWTLGNLLIGGVVGVGVDAATGALNDYPNAFQVPMTPLETAAAPAPAPAPAPVATMAPVNDTAEKPKTKPAS